MKNGLQGEIMEKNKRENMSNVFYFLGRILTNKLVIALIIIAVLGGISLGVKQVAFTDNKTTKLGFEDIGELATQEARCTEVNVTDQSKKLFGIKIPFTQSKYIYSYDVVVKAGIDFNKITWSVKDKTITVKMPESKILSCELDMDSFKVYHEEESIFTPIKLADNNDALKMLIENAKQDAVANGLLENAESNAETILRGFFANVYDLQKYKIEFIRQEAEK